MINTTFSLAPVTFINWPVIVQIAILDLTLSANNAIVAAPSCAALAPLQRFRAMVFGGAAAIALRAALLAALTHVIDLPYVRLFGGAYLCFAGYHLLTQEAPTRAPTRRHTSIGRAIRAIAFGDVLMSIDNVLAISAITQRLPRDGVEYGVAGVCLSIPVVMFGARLLAVVISRLPIVMWIGGGLLGWVGVDLMLAATHVEFLNRIRDGASSGSVVAVADVTGFLSVVLLARCSNQRAARSRPLNLN